MILFYWISFSELLIFPLRWGDRRRDVQVWGCWHVLCVLVFNCWQQRRLTASQRSSTNIQMLQTAMQRERAISKQSLLQSSDVWPRTHRSQLCRSLRENHPPARTDRVTTCKLLGSDAPLRLSAHGKTQPIKHQSFCPWKLFRAQGTSEKPTGRNR